MKIEEISPGIFWIGAMDSQLRVFDIIMMAEHGTTYNSYLVKGARKVALIDTVKHRFRGVLLSKLAEALGTRTLDYIVLNHLEPDHSGSVAQVLESHPKAQIYISRPGAKFLQELLNRDTKPHIIAEGERLNLGGKTLRFFEAPFLHWPDTIFTFVEENKVLFPCDVFGCHFCDERLYDDEVDAFDHTFRYYFDIIIRPFKEYMKKAIGKLEGLDIKTIAPSHGPILRTRPWDYIEKYREWCALPSPSDTKLILVMYLSIYGNTQKMAFEIASGAKTEKSRVAVFDIQGTNLAGILDQVEAADAIVLGSPTVNFDAVKPAWDFLSSLATLKLKGKVGATFGSYGWSGEAPQMIYDRLKSLKLRMVGEPLRAVLAPTEGDLEKCRALGKAVADAVLGKESRELRVKS